MAIYHLSVKTISRSAGRSAPAAAAYRAGAKITDERTGEIHDYTRKSGVISADLILPSNAPNWANDREQLWNAAEQAETRKNSTVAREFEVALPDELTPSERLRLSHDFARELVARHGCAADVAIHAPSKEGDDRNHHAHILLSTRRLGLEGFGEKTRELDAQKTGSELVTQWRERFAELTNERLQENGITSRVDHRTLEAQGIDREPTQHLGPSATAIERRTGQASSKRQDYQQAAASLAATGAQAEQRRIESMNSAELAAEIKRLTPPPVSDLVKQDQSFANASRATYQLMTRETDASIAEGRIAREIADWREAHKVQVWAHDKGIKVAPELRELEERQAAHRAEHESLRPLIEDAKQHERTIREEAEKRIEAEQKPLFAKIFELKTALREKTRNESKQSAPQPIELKAETRQQTRAELLDEFAKAHAERGLYFNRDYEQGEIQALQPDKAREYLQSALEARTERQQASEQDRGLEL